jgi:glycosyltransferase involved in cell wall biosynthesis
MPMSHRPYFTIGIPTYNRANYLQQAVNSALSQTCSDFELIVSDNASTDDTPAVVAGIKDSRFRFVRQPANLGAVRNIDFLLQAARGRFFILHQDDDLLHREFLSRCQQVVGDRTDVSLFASEVYSGPQPEGVLGEDIFLRDSPWLPVSHIQGKVTQINGVDVAIMQLFSLPFIPPGIAFNTEILRSIGGIFSKFTWANDNITIARIALCGIVLYDPHIGAFMRLHTSNFSRQLPRDKQRACRREANRIIISHLDAVAPDWPERARVCLGYLSKRRRIRFLTEAWKNNYPAVLKQILVESIAGRSPVRKFFCHLSVIFFRANIWRALSSHFWPKKPSD